jgi:uncharacterized protein
MPLTCPPQLTGSGMLPGQPSEAPRIDSRYCCFRLGAGASKIEGWGVYAEEVIPPRRKVIEYTGEKINRQERKRREDSKYLFQLDNYWTIDGSVGGSGAEFINHSCEPNLQSRIVSGRILYFSLRPIQQGEELTVDYNFDARDEAILCRCRSAHCRGTINLK